MSDGAFQANGLHNFKQYAPKTRARPKSEGQSILRLKILDFWLNCKYRRYGDVKRFARHIGVDRRTMWVYKPPKKVYEITDYARQYARERYGIEI